MLSDNDETKEEHPGEDVPCPCPPQETSLPLFTEQDGNSMDCDLDDDLDDNLENLEDAEPRVVLSFWQRRAQFVARHPWWHLGPSLLVVCVLAVIGMVVGNFSVQVDNAGWISRGTLIANRHTQVMLVQYHQYDLATGSEAVWEDLLNNVQPGWQSSSDLRRRRLETETPNHLPRTLQYSLSSFICSDYYETGQINNPWNLSPIWKPHSAATSALDPRVIHDICVAETNTLSVLDQQNLCERCYLQQQCYPPLSLVLFARIQVGDTSLSLSCDQLAQAWEAQVETATQTLITCVEAIRTEGLVLQGAQFSLPTSCPLGFHPAMVDSNFGSENPVVQHTASLFATPFFARGDDTLYQASNQFDRAINSTVVKGTYDNEWGDFNYYYTQNALQGDMILALGSAIIVAAAILVHTRSIWLTFVGVLQVSISFPLAYFIYVFVARLQFFPLLNFIGIFVVFALGADDVFVVVDKWKNARLDYPHATREDIAATALPDAAEAMALTSITTAVAFFSTAICPVAPLRCFAIFCGLLITLDYLLCVALVFPALCIYDQWLARGNNFCCSLHVCKKGNDNRNEWELEQEEEKTSMVRWILTWLYKIIHNLRWILLVLCLVALVVSAIFAARLELPLTSDVRLLRGSIEFEQNYEWRLKLLYTALQKSSGAPGFVMWGLTPADTGDHQNPKTWSQLVLDDRFDPTSLAAQEFLLVFCDKFFALDFAGKTSSDYRCPMEDFDSWLADQSNATYPTSTYLDHCQGASGIPVPEDAFHPCITAWAQTNSITSVLQRNNILEGMYILFRQRIRFDSPYHDLDKEWHLIEDWMNYERSLAPSGVNAVYHSSIDFWWYDTNGRMLQAAYGAAAITLGFSGLVVLVSSRSVVLTIFSLLTIAYVLTATTAVLVASGWTLGFLESINFAILIGISCDFVIHFGHAYAYLSGRVSRHDRTKRALLIMGPSILAAAFTTICPAILMLFTVITFFFQFAQILFYTILHATIGSFIFFLTLTDCLGPHEPTYIWDNCFARCGCRKKKQVIINVEN